jgi:hypothetical protein
MDTAFLRAILEHDGAVPEGYSVQGLTPELLELLGSADMGRREASLDILSGWIYRGPGVYYSASVLQDIGRQMAQNLTLGIGEQGTDTVFRRAFSALILGEVISADNRQALLDAAQVHTWLEQGLAYLRSEQDRRGWVPGKGWAHGIAHASDLLSVLSRSRYAGEVELARILEAIGDKVGEPAGQAYIYEEDERLVSAVMSVLLRDVLDIAYLTTWLDRMTQPPGQVPWSKVLGLTETDETLAFARFNTVTFLRSLYFQLLLGNNPHPSFAKRTPAMRDALLPAILAALRVIDRWAYAK